MITSKMHTLPNSKMGFSPFFPGVCSTKSRNFPSLVIVVIIWEPDLDQTFLNQFCQSNMTYGFLRQILDSICVGIDLICNK